MLQLMDPLEFLMMSPWFEMMEIVVALLLCYFLWLLWVRLSKNKFTGSYGNFHVRVICERFYKKIFGILTHTFMILYEFENIEWPTHLFESNWIFEALVEHEPVNYKSNYWGWLCYSYSLAYASIRIFQKICCQHLLCWTKYGLKIYFYC